VFSKVVKSADEALKDVEDGNTIMISGFGDPGMPFDLVDALFDIGPRELTLVANNAGAGYEGIAALIDKGLVSKIICAYPRRVGSVVFEEMYQRGSIELELVPQGTLSERIRAGKAGLGGFYTPTAYGTPLAEGKEVRKFNERQYVLELPLSADFSLIRACMADPFGNLTYQASQRNYGPVMAGAARHTIAEVDKVVGLGDLNPEVVVTPGIFVDRVVQAI
jgi:3-oxoadipate CoA-transferase alpha subunit